MPIYFADSSALVKRYRSEDGSARVLDLLESAGRTFVSRLAAVEVSSALVRRARSIKLSAENLTAALALFDADLAGSLDIIELDQPLMKQAVDVARRHGLRGADAIQLASAQFAQREVLPDTIILLSSDVELNAAAAAEGLQVENPNPHP
jgi:uncharacterized protein